VSDPTPAPDTAPPAPPAPLVLHLHLADGTNVTTTGAIPTQYGTGASALPVMSAYFAAT
jgi:hypothetical protein